jgi:hypothetical protein
MHRDVKRLPQGSMGLFRAAAPVKLKPDRITP